jgi:hypothetical protein
MGIMARRRIADQKKQKKQESSEKKVAPQAPEKPRVAQPKRRVEKIPASLAERED